MAGVERDADVRLILHAIHDRGELIEIAATFRAFAGHGRQKHHDAIRTLEHLIQSLADQPAACLGALAHMRAGMNVDIRLLAGLAGWRSAARCPRPTPRSRMRAWPHPCQPDCRRTARGRPTAHSPQPSDAHRTPPHRPGRAPSNACRTGNAGRTRTRCRPPHGSVPAAHSIRPSSRRDPIYSSVIPTSSVFHSLFVLPLSYGRRHRAPPAQPT